MGTERCVVIVPEPLLNSLSAPTLRQELLAVPAHVDIRVDLSNVRFCGQQAAAAIFAAVDARDLDEGALELFDPSPPALRCIADYGLAEFVSVVVPAAT